MMRYLLFLLPLFLIAPYGRAIAQRVITYSANSYLIRLSIDTLGGRCVASEIDVVRPGDTLPIQSLVPPENDIPCALPDNQILIAEDIDFDGYDDLRLVQFLPAAPNVPYYYWRYSEQLNLFERDTALEEITSPDFDHEKHLIHSFWRGGWRHYGASIYAYIDGKPTLIEERESRDDPDRPGIVILTVRVLVDGQMETTVTEAVSEQEEE